MRALSLAVLKVLRLDEVDTGASPLFGERVCVIHVHVDGSATHPLRINAGSREMDRQIVAMGERIPLVIDEDLAWLRASWTTPPEFARMVEEFDRVVSL